MSGDLEPYFEEDDGHGCVLAVHGYDGRAVVQVTDGPGEIRVVSWVADPLTAPDLCRGIFQAAGLEPPVMLGRPELPPGGSSATFGGWRFYPAPGGEVGIMLHELAWSGSLPLEQDGRLPRWIAAVADAYAEPRRRIRRVRG